MMTDPIADMLTRIRNAQMARKSTTNFVYSKLKMRIAEILKTEGYVENVETVEDGGRKSIVVTLKYRGRAPYIQSLKRESKPGHRRYCKAEELPRILNDYGVAILSTSQGLMTNKEARTKGVGGEIICSVY